MHHHKLSHASESNLPTNLKLLKHFKLSPSPRTTDASLSGMGILSPPYWSHFIFSQLPTDDIAVLEAQALVAAFATFGHLKGKRVLCFVDNEAVKFAFQKKSSKESKILHYIRQALIWAAANRVYFFVEYLDTHSNFLADSLSRGYLEKFWTLAKLTNITFNQFPSTFKLLC